MSVTKVIILYSKDLVVSHVYSHIPYSKNLIVSMFLDTFRIQGIFSFYSFWTLLITESVYKHEKQQNPLNTESSYKRVKRPNPLNTK